MKQTTCLVFLLLILVGIMAVAFRQRDETGAPEAADSSEKVITLRGATQFDENHAFTRTIRRFEELTAKYYGRPIVFELYLNSELGAEKDYFAYMSQGNSVDYAIVSPSHMSTFSASAPLMDMPFLFRDLDHWNKVLESDALQPIVDEVAENADVRLLGYAGGGVRNLIVNRAITNIQELKGLNLRVMGAPIQSSIFQAIGTSPTVIAYNEVYNAIQTGVIDGAENEAAGLQQMKFYEVGPEVSLTQHAITVRPLCFSGKTFRRLPPDLQAAIIRAGREAGAFGRQLESTEDSAILSRLEREHKTRTHRFTQRDDLLRLAAPVKSAYARKINATEVLTRINALE